MPGLSALAKQDWSQRCHREQAARFTAILSILSTVPHGAKAGRLNEEQVFNRLHKGFLKCERQTASACCQLLVAVLKLHGYEAAHDGEYVLWAKERKTN